MTGPDFGGQASGGVRSLQTNRWGEHDGRGGGLRRAESRAAQGPEGRTHLAQDELKDRIDAIIAHEYEELRAGGKHAEAIKNAAKTELPISDEARRLNRARAR